MIIWDTYDEAEDKEVKITLSLPDQFVKEMKSQAVLYGTTLKDIVTTAISDYLYTRDEALICRIIDQYAYSSNEEPESEQVNA